MKFEMLCPHCGNRFNGDEQIKLHVQNEVDKSITSKLKAETAKMESAIRKKVKEENADTITELQIQLKERTNDVKSMSRLKADLARVKREKETMKEQIEADAEEKLTQILKKERHKIQRDAQEKLQLKINANELLIKQLNEQLKKAQQKAEQGSMQVQGEVMEIELQKVLQKAYPQEVKEIGKGVNGCDIILAVHNSKKEECGVIAIECKNTKSFSMGWIDKLKADQRIHKADIAVLVTSVMPKNMTTFGFLNGVWIVGNIAELTALLFVLRESLIRIHEVKSSNEGGNAKAIQIYDYVRSNEFAGQITSIVEAMNKMRIEMQKEQLMHTKQWKERDKIIESTAAAAVEIISEVKSIASSSFKSIRVGELPLLASNNGHGENEI